MEAFRGDDYDDDDGSDDISVSSDDEEEEEEDVEQEELPRSATRVAREMLEGENTVLESARPAPTRKIADQVLPKPKITQVNTIFNYGN